MATSQLGGSSCSRSGAMAAQGRKQLIEEEVRSQISGYVHALLNGAGVGVSSPTSDPSKLVSTLLSKSGRTALQPNLSAARALSSPDLRQPRGHAVPSSPLAQDMMASAGDMTLLPSYSDARLNSATAGSQLSRGSHRSAASMRSMVEEAVRAEVEKYSALKEYYRDQEAAAQRKRKKNLDRPVHLRTGTNPIDTGCPIEYCTQTQRSLKLPVSMAVDPKWSSDLKKMNDKIGVRITYERRLSGSIPGQLMPELPYMYKKPHLSNPPTPYFQPGISNLKRSSNADIPGAY
eukprot:TRINITY_DN41379_c0_g1_i1.p1 TRINITY_DN41379_c0_g1~~TRINITY_DN41379_c0_g1_i1.p1  ORF type:complete len:290 (+),score=66.06 TRINITY_DN41379_c0_g1_i1:79-948(+)